MISEVFIVQSYYESSRDNIRMTNSWYDRRNTCMPHFHAGIELVYVLEGCFTASINGQSMDVSAGEMLVNNCYSVHSYACNSPCFSIVTVIPLSIVPSVQKLLTSNRFRTHLIRDDERHTLELFMRTLAEHPDNDTLQKGVSYALLGYLTERIPLDPVASSDQANILCDILNYLSDHFAQRLTVEQVAAHFGYSRSRFSHLFKSTIGYSLPQYLNMLRCRSICESLLTTDTPVVDLAVSAGFNNVHTFYTAFRSCYHMTPKEYARMHRTGRTAERTKQTAE